MKYNLRIYWHSGRVSIMEHDSATARALSLIMLSGYATRIESFEE
jgi:hypothetical protein